MNCFKFCKKSRLKNLSSILILGISSCTSSFEDEALVDTPNRTVPLIEGVLPLKKASHHFSPTSWDQKISNLTLKGINNQVLNRESYGYAYSILDEVKNEIIKTNSNVKYIKDLDWNIFITDSKDKNAFSLGYGRIVVTKELLLSLKNREELAGIIAHEMSHNLHRDNVKRMGLILPLFIATPLLMRRYKPSRPKAILYGLTAFTGLNTYSRFRERKADYKACDMLLNSKYKTGGLHNFFQDELDAQNEKMMKQFRQAKERNETKFSEEDYVYYIRLLEFFTGFLSTHPNTQTRIDYITKYLGENLQSTSSVMDHKYQEMKLLLVLNELEIKYRILHEELNNEESEVD